MTAIINNGCVSTDNDEQITDEEHLAIGQECLAAALDYRSWGWSPLALCPPNHDGVECQHAETCHSPGKRPLYDWVRWQTEIAPEHTVNGWWRYYPLANVGVALGSASGLVRLDIEDAAGEQLLYDTFSIDSLPETLEFFRPNSGSCGLLFAIPHGVSVRKKSDVVNHSGWELLGQGQQTAMPPSLHPSGYQVEWLAGHGPNEIEAAPMPDWMVAAMAPDNDEPGRREPVSREPSEGRRYMLQNARRTRLNSGNSVAVRRAMRYLEQVPSAISGSGGHDATFRVSCVLVHGFTLSIEDATAAIGPWNDRCEPPWSAAEIQHKLQSASDCGTHERPRGYLIATSPSASRVPSNNEEETTDPAAVPEVRYYNCTDTGNAKRLIDLHGDRIRYVDSWREWLQWTGTHWDEAPAGAILRLTEDVAVAWHDVAAAAYEQASEARWEAAGDEEDREHKRAEEAVRKRADGISTWGIKSESSERRHAMLKLAIAEPGVTIKPDELDRHHHLINFNNGTFDLTSQTLYTHDSDQLLTQIAPVDYNPNAVCPAYDRFASQVFRGDQEVIDFVHRYLGSCLSGDVSEHLALFCIGGGDNGKSTLISVIEAVLGPYFTAAGSGLLIGQPVEGTKPDPEKMRLRGKRIASLSETVEGARLNEAALKTLIGNGTITGRNLHQNSWSFEPTHKLVFASNHRPIISGGGHGTWRRIALIDFKQRFLDPTDSNFVAGMDLPKNRDLLTRLRTEKSGILNRWISGYSAWLANGKNSAPPASVRAATDEYRDTEDTFGQFAHECLQVGEGMARRVLGTAVREIYAAWCEDNGTHPLGVQRFGHAMTRVGAKWVKTNRGIAYTNLVITIEANQQYGNRTRR